MKMHTLLNLHGNIPTFIRTSDGKLHDGERGAPAVLLPCGRQIHRGALGPDRRPSSWPLLSLLAPTRRRCSRQIRIAVSVCVLAAIAGKRLGLEASLYQILQGPRHHALRENAPFTGASDLRLRK